MGSSETTHVVEIEAGIGEPTFIPLVTGQELQPISVGRKGMWRIESARVLDVHAFLYFDRASLFVQSADNESVVTVSGRRIGTVWTELFAPCTLEIGSARLRYRSLLDDAESQPTMMGPSPYEPKLGAMRPPGASMPAATAPAPPPGPTARLGASSSRDQITDRPVGQRAQAAATPPLLFPKTERGLNAEPPPPAVESGDSTRIAPRDASAGRYGSVGPPRVGSGMLSTDDSATVLGAPRPRSVGAIPVNQASAGALAAHDPRGPTMPPGLYGPGPYPKGGATVTSPRLNAGALMARLVAQAKATSRPTLLAGALFAIGGILYLTTGNDVTVSSRRPPSAPPGESLAQPSSASVPAGAQLSPPPVRMPTVAALPAWPANVPCPPANWPPSTPLPCVPNAAGTPSERTAKETGAKGEPKAPTTPAQPPAAKSLERQAVDYVAGGDVAKAVAAYDELVRRDPSNAVYVLAARILRAKLEGATAH